jgi:hypothetical protein
VPASAVVPTLYDGVNETPIVSVFTGLEPEPNVIVSTSLTVVEQVPSDAACSRSG